MSTTAFDPSVSNEHPIGHRKTLFIWLGVEVGELEWFADLNHYLKKPRVGVTLRHYTYRILGKAAGRLRLIESLKIV